MRAGGELNYNPQTGEEQREEREASFKGPFSLSHTISYNLIQSFIQSKPQPHQDDINIA